MSDSTTTHTCLGLLILAVIYAVIGGLMLEWSLEWIGPHLLGVNKDIPFWICGLISIFMFRLAVSIWVATLILSFFY